MAPRDCDAVLPILPSASINNTSGAQLTECENVFPGGAKQPIDGTNVDSVGYGGRAGVFRWRVRVQGSSMAPGQSGHAVAHAVAIGGFLGT